MAKEPCKDCESKDRVIEKQQAEIDMLKRALSAWTNKVTRSFR